MARELGSVSFAGFQAVSLLSALLALTLGFLVVGGRIAAFRSEPYNTGLWSALGELRLLLATEWRLLKRRGHAERFLLAGLTTYVVTITLRDTMRVVRFCIWEGPIRWLGLDKTFIARPFVWLYGIENLLEFASLIAILSALVGLVTWIRHRPGPAQPSAPLSVRAVSALPVVLDVQSASARGAISSAFHGDLLRRALDALASFCPDGDIVHERDLQLRLFEHLESAGFAVGFEVQLGDRNRVDLAIDEAIAIELKFGALRANERNRVIGQSRTYAKRWVGRGPLLVVCVGAPEERIREVSHNAEAWNRALTEHPSAQSAPAPIFVVTQVASGAPSERVQ